MIYKAPKSEWTESGRVICKGSRYHSASDYQ